MRRTSYNIPGQAHFLTLSCYRRTPILADTTACRALAESLDNARRRLDFALWAYVFMPDHVHLLIRPTRPDHSLPYILRHIKGPFAKRLIAEWRQHHPRRLLRLQVPDSSPPQWRVWQRGGGFDRNLYSDELVRRAVTYIEWNPVRKGLVTDPCGWEWSSARARAGQPGMVLRIDELRLYDASRHAAGSDG